MIPKIIHYCWFGNNEIPYFLKQCIESWHIYCPDYKFILWNEENFDISINDYVQEAYKEKKYAFVSDYVRLYALKKYGGIYLDTDVEIKQNLDTFLQYDFVVGFEAPERVATAIIMANVNNEIVDLWLSNYSNRHYFLDKKSDNTTNVVWLTKYLVRLGLNLDGKRQSFNEQKIVIFEKNVFCPYSIGDKRRDYTDSYTVHWCDASWVGGKGKYKLFCIKVIKSIIGTTLYEKIRRKIKGI